MALSENTIAFIGVMGFPMAVNLRTKMDPATKLLVCDVSPEQIEKFRKAVSGNGEVEVVQHGAEAARQANTVLTMLPTSASVESVYLHPETGILAGAKDSKADLLVVECGTIETATILKVGKAFQDAGVATFVDGPVSGGPMGAQDGTLTFMVGGSPQYFPRVRDVLSNMGIRDNIFLCGDVGAGTAFKVINNYLSAITSLAASEALNIGVKMGLDAKLLTDVINTSGGQCWVTSKSNPVPGVHPNAPASRGYEGGFRIELCKKVLKMGIDLADMVDAKTVLSIPTLEAFETVAADDRYKGKDARVVYKWLNEAS